MESSSRQVNNQNIIGGLELSIAFNSQDDSFLNEAMDDYDIERVMTNIDNELKIKNNAMQQDFQCNSCEKTFASAIDLKKHGHSHNNDDINDESDDTSTNWSNFDQESLRKVKKYTCYYCDQKFMDKIALKGHMECHITAMGHKDNKCEFCGKSFSEARTLKRHIHIIHEGHRDYKCESCSKSFTQAGYLNKHIHTVHGATKITNVNLVANHFLKQGI